MTARDPVGFDRPPFGLPRASHGAWVTTPAVQREKRRSFVAGFVVAMVVYGIASLVLVLAFGCLGVR